MPKHIRTLARVAARKGSTRRPIKGRLPRYFHQRLCFYWDCFQNLAPSNPLGFRPSQSCYINLSAMCFHRGEHRIALPQSPLPCLLVRKSGDSIHCLNTNQSTGHVRVGTILFPNQSTSCRAIPPSLWPHVRSTVYLPGSRTSKPAVSCMAISQFYRHNRFQI